MLKRQLSEEAASSLLRRKELEQLKESLENSPKLTEMKEQIRSLQRQLQQEKQMRVTSENHAKEMESMLERRQQTVSLSAQSQSNQVRELQVKMNKESCNFVGNVETRTKKQNGASEFSGSAGI